MPRPRASIFHVSSVRRPHCHTSYWYIAWCFCRRLVFRLPRRLLFPKMDSSVQRAADWLICYFDSADWLMNQTTPPFVGAGKLTCILETQVSYDSVRSPLSSLLLLFVLFYRKILFIERLSRAFHTYQVYRGIYEYIWSRDIGTRVSLLNFFYCVARATAVHSGQPYGTFFCVSFVGGCSFPLLHFYTINTVLIWIV